MADPPLQVLLRDRDSRGRVIREQVRVRREATRLRHDEGASGTTVVRAWTAAIDELLIALFRAVLGEREGAAAGVALFALGEYGRRFLSPHSELDLLILHQPGADPAKLVEGLLYPLWDARLDVQGIARTPEENLELARRDIRSRHNLLEGRFLCGDPSLEKMLAEPVLSDTIPEADMGHFIDAGVDEMQERHARYGDTVYLLEPQVNEGQGGLRDIQTALSIAKARFRVRTVTGLAQKGLVPAEEIEALEEARDFLLRIRNHLHFLCGRREDRLSFELQDEAAPFFGHSDTADGLGAEKFLQRFYACANLVGHFTDTLIRRAGGRLHRAETKGESAPRDLSPGVRLQGGEIYLGAEDTEREPLAMLLAFEAAQQYAADLSPQALQVMRDNLPRVDDRYRRDPDAVAVFLRILQHSRGGADTLLCMHDVRFLDRFIPELEHIFGRVQRDLYHSYPVDVHCLFAIQELRRLARGDYDQEFPEYAAAMGQLERPHVLYLAALLHDVGKGEGSRHEERGAELAIQVADRMDLEPRDRGYLEFLVRDHLVLSLTAQSRDLHDEELIADFASRVGDPEALRLLHLLTFADVRAVGPAAWSSWKHLLFRELYEKAMGVLEHGPPRRDIAGARVEAVRSRLRAAARELVPEAEVEAFLAHIGHPRYLLANPVEVLLRHLGAFQQRGATPVVEWRAVPAEGYTEVLLVTRDQPGLFATVAGLMASHRINILSAILTTRTDGWVVDVFHVTPSSDASQDGAARWEGWRRNLAEVLGGAVNLAEMIGERLRSSSALQRPRPQVPVRVAIDNHASARFTVVDLSGPDRLGLLYDVTRAIAEEGLTIRLAKIVTMIHRVADAFYVERLGGGKLSDPEAIARLSSILEDVVASTPGERAGT